MSRPVNVNTNCLQIERQAHSNCISNHQGGNMGMLRNLLQHLPGVCLVMRDLFPTALYPPVTLGEEVNRVTYENAHSCMTVVCSAQDIRL